jgi:hypothetical protein
MWGDNVRLRPTEPLTEFEAREGPRGRVYVIVVSAHSNGVATSEITRGGATPLKALGLPPPYTPMSLSPVGPDSLLLAEGTGSGRITRGFTTIATLAPVCEHR